MRRYIIALALIFSAVLPTLADGIIVVGKSTRIFDKPTVNGGFVTRGMDDEEITVLPGMAFSSEGNKNGWHKIEYLSGVHSFIENRMIADPSRCEAPAAGEYSIANKNKKVTVSQDGSGFSLKDSKNVYKGKMVDNVVVFTDISGNVAYTGVVLDGTPCFFDYTEINW